MRKFLIATTLLLIAASGLQAQALKVSKPGETTGPPGWAEMRGQRSENTKTFISPDSTKSATFIGMEPLHYKDPVAGWVELDFAARDTAGTFNKKVSTGLFDVYYSTLKPGVMRFSSKKNWVEYIPAFDSVDVDVEMAVTPRGVKENLYLTDKSPTRLAWSYRHSGTHEKGLLGKGQIKDGGNKLAIALHKFTATDAKGKAVPLTVTYVADSLFVDVDTAKVTWPIIVDPTVTYDTAIAADTMCVTYRDGTGAALANWKLARNAASANLTAGNETLGWWVEGGQEDGTMWVVRGFLKWYIPELGTTLDSARLFVKASQVLAATDTLRFIQGTWTGYATRSSFNDFTGWPDSTAYDGAVEFVDSMVFANDSIEYSAKFKAAGLSALDAAEGDTIRMILMHNTDFKNDTTQAKRNNNNRTIVHAAYAKPYFIVYADGVPSSPPEVVTLANYDTVKVTAARIHAQLVGHYMSSGGGLDSAGYVIYLKGNTADTLTAVADSAGLTWVIADSTYGVALAAADSLLKDTLYVITAFGANGAARAYSTVRDTISTYVPPGSAEPDLSSTTFLIVELGGITAFTYEPSVTPIADRSVEFFILDSVGTDTLSSVGGPFEPGSFSIAATLAADTSYVYRILFTDALGDHVSIWDTISTTQTGGSIGEPIEVMGIQGTRFVNW